MRRTVIDLNGLNGGEEYEFIQLVGDSSPFGKGDDLAETQVAFEFLKERISENSIINYGFTGNNLKGRMDTNELLNQLMLQQANLSNRVIGNLVGYHSLVAISQWGCTFSDDIPTLVMVYGEDNEAAKFGDDLISSDGLMKDKLILIEGGVQSFAQSVNALAMNIPIRGIYNLRGQDFPDCSNSVDDLSISRKNLADGRNHNFSAAEFLSLLKDEFAKQYDMKPEDRAQELFEVYTKKHALFNDATKASSAKFILFNQARSMFIEKKLWEKLDLFEVKEHQNKKNIKRSCANVLGK